MEKNLGEPEEQREGARQEFSEENDEEEASIGSVYGTSPFSFQKLCPHQQLRKPEVSSGSCLLARYFFQLL